MAGVRAERQDAANQIDTKLRAWRKEKARAQAEYIEDIPQDGGQPLSDPVKQRMQGQLGNDLSGVKVHTGGESAKAADGLGARAFTVGQDVHFGAGEFAPGTKEGDRLLAHELTHTVQGARSGVRRKAEAGSEDAAADEVSQPHEPAEREADAVADHVTDKLHGGDHHGEGGAHAPGAKEAAPAIGAKLAPGAAIMRAKTGDAPAAQVGSRDIDKKKPTADASETDWLKYLTELHEFLRNQAGAEKNALLDMREQRDEHPVTGAISDAAGTIKGGFEAMDDIKKAAHDKKQYQPRYMDAKVKVPDEGIWDQVFAQLNAAHALFAGGKPDIEAAKQQMAVAVRLFRDAHRRTFEYKSRREEGGAAAANTLRGVEAGCDITLVVLSAGLGAGGANVLKLGVKGTFKLLAEQTMKSGLVKTAAKAAAVAGANALAQGATEEARGYAIDLNKDFDAGKILQQAGTAAATTFLGYLMGGALNKVFMRTLGEILGARMAPKALLALAEKFEVPLPLPPEIFVSRGWQFLVGIVGDGCTTTLMTALQVTIEKLRTGGKSPTGEQFVSMVVEQMIQNGLLQIIFTAVTHERAKPPAKSAGAHGVPADHGAPDHAASTHDADPAVKSKAPAAHDDPARKTAAPVADPHTANWKHVQAELVAGRVPPAAMLPPTEGNHAGLGRLNDILIDPTMPPDVRAKFMKDLAAHVGAMKDPPQDLHGELKSIAYGKPEEYLRKGTKLPAGEMKKLGGLKRALSLKWLCWKGTNDLLVRASKKDPSISSDRRGYTWPMAQKVVELIKSGKLEFNPMTDVDSNAMVGDHPQPGASGWFFAGDDVPAGVTPKELTAQLAVGAEYADGYQIVDLPEALAEPNAKGEGGASRPTALDLTNAKEGKLNPNASEPYGRTDPQGAGQLPVREVVMPPVPLSALKRGPLVMK